MNMTGHKLFTLAALALLAVACNREAISPDKGQDEVIDFSAFFAQDATKAVGEKTTLADKDTMGVFACYTGAVRYDLSSVSPDFMYNQKVTYNYGEGNWTYSPVKYWPNNSPEYISFFSYYPYISSEDVQNAKDGIIGFSNTDAKGDPWLVFKLPKKAPTEQTDLLYGTPQFDKQKMPVSGVNSKVKFQLNHALTSIADAVTIKMSDDLYHIMKDTLDITITGINIEYRNLTNKARLVLNSVGQPNWKEVISGELLTSRSYRNKQIDTTFRKTVTSNPEAKVIDLDHGLFYIPLQIAGQPRPEAEITLAYTVIGIDPNDSFKDSVSTVISFDPGDPGTKKTLALTLTQTFNLDADIVTHETGGISMSGDLAVTDEDVKIDYELKIDTLVFTGDVQTYTIPRTGKYMLEARGAQGGKGTTDGAEGGIAKAEFNLSIGDVLYVYVGGKGEDATTSSGGNGGWNGGGRGGDPDGTFPGGGGGGGATHIAISNIGAISSTSSTKLSSHIGFMGDLLLVAGGGGGGSWKADSAGAGGGEVGNKGRNGTPTYLADWNNGDFSYGAIGGPGGSIVDGGGREGNGGGGGGYLGGSARTIQNVSGSGSAYGGSGGNSNANITRYNFVTGSFSTDTEGTQTGNGLVRIEFKESL